MLAFILSTLSQAKKEEISCPHGFELHGDMCKRWVDRPLQPICKKGALVGKDRCVVKASPFPKCLSGEFSDKMCHHWDTTSPDLVCPPGYEMGFDKKDSHCQRSISFQVQAPCPAGTVDSGKDCISYSYTPAEIWCPPGTEHHGEMCASYMTYDCTPKKAAVPVVKAKKGKKHGGHGGHHHRMLGAKKAPMVIGKGKAPPITKTKMVQQTCEKVMKTPAIKKCPPGTVQQGKKCKSTHSHPRGVLDKVKVETAPPEAICPHPFEWCASKKGHGHGHKKHGESSCCLHKTEEPIYKCPDGLQHTHEGCVAEYQPIWICPEVKHKKKHGGHGSLYGGDSFGKGDECGEWEYVQPVIKMTVMVQEDHKKHKKHHH